MCSIRRFYGLRELYEADFHKLGIYGSGRVWANAWDVFRRAPSRSGRGRRAAADFVVCFRGGGYILCVSVSVCVTFVVLTDCESCTGPISTNPGYIEEGEYGLTRGTCSIARSLELVAVARLLWVSWCVLGGAGFVYHVFLLQTHTASCTYAAASCLIYLSTSTGVRTGCH